MGAIVVTGTVNQNHLLSAKVPDSVPPGPVQILIVPARAEDPAEHAWMAGIAREWADELGDTREDIYSLDDGEPSSAP